MTKHDADIVADPGPQVAQSNGAAPFLERLLLTPIGDLLHGRITGRRPPVRAAHPALPASLQVVVDEVIRRTRLWRSEKRAVGRELTAHFDDGLRAGRTSEQLIESFGDPAQAARLIQRARRRLRPLPWQALQRTKQAILLLLAIIIILYIIAAARLFLSSPTVSRDYVAELNAPLLAIAESERAWPRYRAALLAMEPLPLQHSAADALRPEDEGWSDAAAWLSRNEAALAQIRAASALPALGYVPATMHHPEDMELWNRAAARNASAPSAVDQPQTAPPPPVDVLAGSMMAVLLPHLAELRRMSGMLVTDAFRAAHEGDGATLAADVRAVVRLAEQAQESPTLINQLVAIAILWRGFDALGELLTSHSELFSDGDLAALAHELARIGDGGPLRLDFHGERLFFQDLVQRTYTEGGLGGGHLTPEGIRVLDMFGQRRGEIDSFTDYGDAGVIAVGPFYSLLAASRDNAVAKWDELMDMVEAEAATPLWQRGESRVEAEIERIKRSSIDSIRYHMVAALLPAVHHANTSAEMATQARNGLLVAIALRLHERRHGGFPATLSELAPALLPEIPRDRSDGLPLKYMLRDGAAIVYSAGADRDDDGGVYVPYPASGERRWSLLDQPARMWLSPQDLQRRSARPLGQSRDIDEIQSGAVPDADWVLWMSAAIAPDSSE